MSEGVTATTGGVPADALPTALTTVEAVVAGRRNVKAFRPTPVPRELIARLIGLAVWAPNHRLTEPWRFYVLDGQSRERLGEVAAAVTRATLSGAAGADPATIERKAAEAAHAWATVPALLYVTVLGNPDPEIDLENYGAACCAVQNLLLAAHAAGLATSWSSGAVAAAPALRALVGASDAERLVGLLRLGYPDTTTPSKAGKRAASEQVTVWVDSHDDRDGV